MAAGGSGPADTSGSTQELAGLVAPITPAKAANAVNVDISFGSRSAVVVGAPQLQLTYRGTSPPGHPADPGLRPVGGRIDRPRRWAIRSRRSTSPSTDRRHTTSVPLEMVAFTGSPDDHLELQLIATTVAYAVPRLGGSIDFTHIHIALPVASDIHPK